MISAPIPSRTGRNFKCLKCPTFLAFKSEIFVILFMQIRVMLTPIAMIIGFSDTRILGCWIFGIFYFLFLISYLKLVASV
jgi:hypothetical protein